MGRPFRLLLAVLCSLTVPSVSPAGRILFQDNFDDGNTDGWQEIDGTFQVIGGEYQITSASFANDARAANGRASWTDYTFEADFNFPAAHAAMLFRIESIASGTDAGRYYQFHVFPTLAGICVMNFSGGNCNRVLDVPFVTTTNTWHHALLRIQGTTVTAYIDGVEVLAYNGLVHYPAGKVALKRINGPGSTLYDNVVVKTAVPASVGVLRGNVSWFLDDGDGAWEGCGVDSCSGFGDAAAVPVTGDFDGDGDTDIGFRRVSSFFLDNGNRVWDGCLGGELCMGLGFPSDQPVVGDWEGDGVDQVGVYRDGSWFLDNGNYQWDGCGADTCAGFGLAGDQPVVGDWDGDGRTEIGLFRDGSWFLDSGNLQWDGCATEICYGLGKAGDQPITGDFNGDGRDQVGVFRSGSWFIDDGDFLWEGCGVDICGGFGAGAAMPVVGDYDGDGRDQIAIYDNGFWAIDDGNFQWDGCGVEQCIGLGQAGDAPVPGRW